MPTVQREGPGWRHTPPFWRRLEALLFAAVFAYTAWGLASGFVQYVWATAAGKGFITDLTKPFNDRHYHDSVLAVVWLLLALGMRVPESLDTRRYQLPTMDSQAVPGLTRRLAGLPGVREVMLSGEGVAYLKVDSQGFDEQNVIKLLGGEI